MLLGALWALVLVAVLGGSVSAAPTAPAATPGVVAAGTWDGRSRLTVTLPKTLPDPGPVSVTVEGSPVPADVVPLLSDRTATAVVVDTSAAAAPVLAPGLSGAASFVLATPPAARSTLVADTTSPAVLSPLQAGPAGTLRGLAEARAGGDRQTGAAVALALAQLPPEADHPRLVVLYTGAPDAPTPAADLAAALTTAGAVLAVVVPSDDGVVPPYWAQVTAATGGLAVAAPGSGVVAAFDDLGDALRTRYLVSFPAPERLPAETAVRVDTGAGPVTIGAALSPPARPAAARYDSARTGIVLGTGAALLALLAAIAVVVRRRRATATTAWNIPARPDPVVDRDQQAGAVREALRAGRPAVLQPVVASPGMGTTTAMIEMAHRWRADYDIAWWIPAADPPLVADRLAELAEVLGVATPGDTAETATERLLALLRARRRWLLIFDDAGSPRQLARFLPGGGHVILGSDDPEWAEHAEPVAVPPFTRAESTGLLRSRCPGLSPAEADQVAAALDDVPLAVDVAGATLDDRAMSVDRYLRLLTGHQPGSAEAASAVALDRLAADDPAASTLLTLLAWFAPEPVPLSLLTVRPEVLPAPLAIVAEPGRLDDLLATVARRGLARTDARPDTHTVQLHPVPAALLVARSGDDASSWAATAVRLLRAAAPADAGHPAARAAWRRLLPHVLVVTDPGRPLDDVLVEVGWLLHHAARYLQGRGESRAARALFEDAYDVYRRQLGPDHPDTLAAARTLADNRGAGT
jgi:hypothetical protein